MSEAPHDSAGEPAQPIDPATVHRQALAFWRARGERPEAVRAGVYLSRVGERTQALLLPGEALGPDAVAANWTLEALREAVAAGAAPPIPIVRLTARGLNNAETAEIAAAGGNLLFPLAFFDLDFRGQHSARDALREAILEERIDLRAPQPFRAVETLSAPPEGPVDDRDLFEALWSRYAALPTGPRLTVLSGPAGVGKTALVSELALRLHDHFNQQKRRNGLATRPLFFQPYDLGARAEQTVDDLIAATLRNAFLKEANPEAVRWLHVNGLSLWIFDGLDEFFRRQSGFFETLEAQLSAPGSRSQVLLCTRDSLMSSAPTLIEFLDRRQRVAPEATRIYELARWDAAAQRRYVAARLGEDKATEALARLQSDPILASLSDLPFYARLIVDALVRGDDAALKDEFSLLDQTLDALIDRESAKLKIDWDVFVSAHDAERIFDERRRQSAVGLAPDGENYLERALQEHGRDTLKLLLGSAAHFYRFATADEAGGGDDDVSIEELGEVLTPIYLNADLDETAEGRLKLALVQFPLFGRGAGGVAFTHDLIADYLAGVFAWDWIERQGASPQALAYALGRRPDIAATSFFRYLRAQFEAAPGMRDKLRAALDGGALGDAASAVARRLLAP